MVGDVVRLAGVENVTYRKDGKDGAFTRLHFVYGQNEVPGVTGCKVEQVFCPREVDPSRLVPGGAYETEYVIRDGKNGKSAVLVGLHRVDDDGPKGK